MFTILHNSRCSKSRKVLEILREHNIEPTVRFYQEDPLSLGELQTLAKQLGMRPIEFVRSGEDEYKAAGLSKGSSDQEVFAEMVKYPKLLERPIVIKDDNIAILGRPPENVLGLIE